MEILAVNGDDLHEEFLSLSAGEFVAAREGERDLIFVGDGRAGASGRRHGVDRGL
jgi:hypothetical protein